MKTSLITCKKKQQTHNLSSRNTKWVVEIYYPHFSKKMISIPALEEGVLILLLYSSEQAPGLAFRLQPEFFTTRVNQMVCKTAIDYIMKYRQPPGGQIEYLLESEIRRGEEGKLLGQTIDLLKEQQSQIQPAFILEQLDRFIEVKKLTNALQEGMELLQQGELDKARERVFKTSNITIADNKGLWLTQPRKIFQAFDRRQEEFFPCGVSTIDRSAGGNILERKTLSFLIAASGKGKTWWLVELGKTGIQHHHNVLHITLELSQEKTALRYLQSIFALTKREAKEVRTAFFPETEGEGMSIEFRDLKRNSVIEKRKEIEKRLTNVRSWGKLLIKEFPTGSLSTSQLELYLDQLEREEGFVPDILIVDYADLMMLDAQSLRIETGRQYKELRSIGFRRNMVVATVSQGNKDSDTTKVVDRRHAAEDWSKIGTADNVFTYSQTVQEKRLGLARFLYAKGRDNTDRVMALISQSYDIGQFCIDSVFMKAEVSEEIGKLTGEN